MVTDFQVMGSNLIHISFKVELLALSKRILALYPQPKGLLCEDCDRVYNIYCGLNHQLKMLVEA